MKFLYYFLRYTVFMLIGFLIKYIGIANVFSLNYIFIGFFCIAVIHFAIKKPIEKRKDVYYDDILIQLIVSTTILLTILMILSGIPISGIIIVNLFNIVELVVFKFLIVSTKNNEDETFKNIANYYYEQNKEKE